MLRRGACPVGLNAEERPLLLAGLFELYPMREEHDDVAMCEQIKVLARKLGGQTETPFFGAWLAWRGLSPGQIGVLLATGMLLRVLVAPITGLVADARNDRRGMMLRWRTVTP